MHALENFMEMKPFYVIYFIFNITVYTQDKKKYQLGNIISDATAILPVNRLSNDSIFRAFPVGVISVFSAL